ncbi:interleukin-5 receptor subunit alpha-like [Heterodontus francisci]|uniref:interleukin-5 receptor subunit alpha-like n=1 Tax=Heterodontus francisci TaxID=7792 RepID=UPI00355C7F1E
MPLAPFFPIMTLVWAISVNTAALTSLEEMIKMNPPTDIQIYPARLGEYVFSWSGKCTCVNDIYYQLAYSYLDSRNDEPWSSSIQTHQEKVDLEYHRGILVQVKLFHQHGHDSEISSNWTKKIFRPPRDLFASVDNLSCIFYGNTYMNCSWDINEKIPQDAQYFLSYRQEYEDYINNCTNYQLDEQRNVACSGHKYEMNLLSNINICVSELSNKTKLPYCRNIIPGHFYILYAPVNVTINKITDEVKWKLPEMDYKPICYTYQINITDWSDHFQKVADVNSTKYVISRDQKKRYSVQVRATVNYNCLQSFYWSDWSKPLHIEPDSMDFSLSTIVAVVTVIFIAIVLVLVFLCTKFKLLSKVSQPIPDPKEKFKGLFEDCDGDFQKWINKNPLLMTRTEECIPVTVNEV